MWLSYLSLSSRIISENVQCFCWNKSVFRLLPIQSIVNSKLPMNSVFTLLPRSFILLPGILEEAKSFAGNQSLSRMLYHHLFMFHLQIKTSKYRLHTEYDELCHHCFLSNLLIKTFLCLLVLVQSYFTVVTHVESWNLFSPTLRVYLLLFFWLISMFVQWKPTIILSHGISETLHTNMSLINTNMINETGLF